jgi:CRP/FNR family transcriptional regulator
LSPAAFAGAISELSEFPLFRNIDPQQIRDLCDGGQILLHRHRDILFRSGEPAESFGIVLSGAYKLSKLSNSGEDAVIHFSSPGDVLAALVMAQPVPRYPLTAQAMGPSRVFMIHRDVYIKSWLATPHLIAQVQALLSNRMGRLQSLRVMQRAPLPAKVASLLLQLVAKDRTSDEMKVSLPLTRQEIADSLGVAVESVIRVMSEWAKQGYIATSDQYIRILKPELIIEQVHELAD